MSAARLLPWPVHEIVDYLAGVFLVLSAFLFGFRDTPAFPVLLAVGVLLLAVAVLTGGRFGVVDVVPKPVHAALDYVIGFFLIGAPFLFGFEDVDDALYCSLFTGLALLVISLLTAYPQRAAAGATGGA